jgi:molecular chaperone DnaK
MYKASANAAPTDGETAAAGSTAAEEPKKEEGVIDAEYVDVDDKK